MLTALIFGYVLVVLLFANGLRLERKCDNIEDKHENMKLHQFNLEAHNIHLRRYVESAESDVGPARTERWRQAHRERYGYVFWE